MAVVCCIAHLHTASSNEQAEHLQEFMTNEAVSEKLTNAYVNLQSHLGKAAETQTTKDPKDPKKIPMTTLRPTYLCLQCSTISSLEDRDAHCQARKHQLCEFYTTCDRLSLIPRSY